MRICLVHEEQACCVEKNGTVLPGRVFDVPRVTILTTVALSYYLAHVTLDLNNITYRTARKPHS